MKKIHLCIYTLLLCLFAGSQIASAQADPFAGNWYRLKNKFRGNGECLEGNQPASPIHNGAAFMDKQQNVTGQIWKLERQPNGLYRLKNKFRGDGECLEGNEAGSPNRSGGAYMDKQQNVSGQFWKVISEGDYYRLETQFRGSGENLEGNVAASTDHKGAAFMDKKQNVTGQQWILEKIEPAQVAAAKNSDSSQMLILPAKFQLHAYSVLGDRNANGKFWMGTTTADNNWAVILPATLNAGDKVVQIQKENTDDGAIAFKVLNYQTDGDYYLTIQSTDKKIIIAKKQGAALPNEAKFMVKEPLQKGSQAMNFVSFESVTFKDHYLRHQGYKMYATPGDLNDKVYIEDASWLFESVK